MLSQNITNLNSIDVWQGAKQILGAVKSNFPTQSLAGGKLLSNPLKMASAVNDFFLAKIIKLKENDPSVNQDEATKELETFLNSKISQLKDLSLENYQIKMFSNL